MLKENICAIELETDYPLLSLHQAVEEDNAKERENCVSRLKEIQDEHIKYIAELELVR